MRLFDGYVAVDWSSKATRASRANSIWIAVRDLQGAMQLKNPATRQEAMDYIEKLLGTATENGQRLLCGFDFAFGYPAGTARMLTHRDSWEAVWQRIAGVIKDCSDNKNNRYDAAAELARIHRRGAVSLVGPAMGDEESGR